MTSSFYCTRSHYTFLFFLLNVSFLAGTCLCLSKWVYFVKFFCYWIIFNVFKSFLFSFFYYCMLILQNNGFHYDVFIHVYNILWWYLPPIPSLFSLPSHWFLSSSQIVSLLLSCLFVKSRFCIWKKTFNICLSEPGLFWLTWFIER
jgi:hypothetical protein